MALPQSRDITIAPGSQIPSTLLNNLQDAIVARTHGAVWVRVDPTSWQGSGQDIANGDLTYDDPVAATSPGNWRSPGAVFGRVFWNPTFAEATTLLQADIWEQDDNITGNDFEAWSGTFGTDSTAASLGTFTFATSAADKVTNVNSTNFAALFPFTISSTGILNLEIAMKGSATRFFGMRLLVRKDT